jgi:hypothetical protein
MSLVEGSRRFGREIHNMESFEGRAAIRRKTWKGFVARSSEELASFRWDAHDAILPSARVEMIWQLVRRLPWGSNATESRLDRSVGRVERRGR